MTVLTKKNEALARALLELAEDPKLLQAAISEAAARSNKNQLTLRDIVLRIRILQMQRDGKAVPPQLEKRFSTAGVGSLRESSMRESQQRIEETEAICASHDARVVRLLAERDTLDCTRREGGDARHCPLDRPCLRCALEAERDALAATVARAENVQRGDYTLVVHDDELVPAPHPLPPRPETKDGWHYRGNVLHNAHGVAIQVGHAANITAAADLWKRHHTWLAAGGKDDA